MDATPFSAPGSNPQNVNPLSGLITVIQQMVKGQQQLITALAALTTATAASTTGGATNTAALVTAIDTITTQIGISFVSFVPVPATATSPGSPGEMAFDATHLYVAVGTNVWVRATLATF